jgi:ATP-dependent protease ClpP protease subunit
MKLASAKNAFMAATAALFLTSCTTTNESNITLTPPSPTNQTATVNFAGPITTASKNQFIATFNAAARSSSTIRVNINSVGGLASGVMQMVNTMEASGRQLYMSCEGLAASAGAIMLITPDGATRNASNQCRIMAQMAEA